MQAESLSAEAPPGPLPLPAVLDLAAAAPLTHAILDRRGAALEIDASAVRRMGGLCLQVLVSAQQQWSEDGDAFSIAATSVAFDEALALFGADPLCNPSVLAAAFPEPAL